MHNMSKPSFWEKYEKYHSGKNKKRIISLSSAEFAHTFPGQASSSQWLISSYAHSVSFW